VADAGVCLEDGREVLGAMENGVVLDVCPWADPDLRLVATQDRAKPHARAGLHHHVSDEDRGRCDVGVLMHVRALAAELKLHWRL
jgi:hypothetical protein